MENEAKKPLELYIHIPFCVKKCDYCDFLSGPAGKERQQEYFQALEREIAAVPDFSDREITTVFIGGGTPSVLRHPRQHGGQYACFRNQRAEFPSCLCRG